LGSSGSRNLILLSDGGDTVSKSNLAAVLKAIGTTGMRVEVVGFRTAESQNAVLASLASAGGGRLLRAGDANALTSAFGSAAAALASQVRVVFDVPPDVGGLQPLVVAAVANNQQMQATATLALRTGTAPSLPATGHSATAPLGQVGPFAAGPRP